MIAMIQKFLTLADSRRGRIFAAWFYQALTAICEGAIYYTLFLVIQDVIRAEFSVSELWQYGLRFLGCTLLQMLFYHLTISLERPVSYAMMRDERLSVAAALKKRPLHWFAKENNSRMTALFTTDIGLIEMKVIEIIAGVVSGLVMTVVFAVMLMTVDARMALLLLVGLLPGMVLYVFFQHSMTRHGARRQQAQVAMTHATLEMTQGMETIKAYALTDAGKMAEKQIDAYSAASQRYEAVLTNWNMAYKIALNSGLFLSLAGGIVFLQNGSLGAAAYLLFGILGILFYRPLENLMGAYAMMNLINKSLDHILACRVVPHENSLRGQQPFSDTAVAVAMEDVCFSYDGEAALSGVSFQAQPGTLTALVGPSGSGKSTLLQVVAGFLVPQRGTVSFNGKDLRTLALRDVVEHVSMVFQDVYLFNDTMMNAIRMGNPAASDEEVVAAAKRARCHDFIMALPQGYDTVIGEGGASLSGGERQRVAIARAILKDAPIVLLDEALSSLDAENALAIQRGIEEMIRGKTVFLVSHTLSYIRSADQILVLDDGRLTAVGRHDDLLDKSPLYAKLWRKENAVKRWSLAEEEGTV